jgi:hypothetical protein
VFGLAFVASVQSAASGEPGHGALDHPSMSAQALGVFDAAAGDAGCDAAFAEPSPQVGVVIAFVAMELCGAAAPWAAGAANGRNPGDERLQSEAVVCVGGRDGDGDGQAATVDDEVDFRSVLAAVGRIRSGQSPPLRARTLTESTAKRDQSRSP